MSGLATLFTILGIAWAVQLFFAWRQAQRFQKQLASLRQFGTVAIGLGGRRYRGGRAYVALAADQQGIVKAGLLLSGMTVVAKGKPFDDYKEFHIQDIISGDRVASKRPTKVIDAARMAAEHIDGYLKRGSNDEKGAE